MGNTLIDQLDASGNLAEYWDLRKGSLIGRKGNTLSVVGTPTPASSRKGRCVFSPHTGSSYLTPGNPVALQLSTFSLFVAATRNAVTPANFSAIMSKISVLTLYHSTGVEPVLFGAWDYTGAAFRASTARTANDGSVNFFGVSFVSGLAGGLQFFANGGPAGSATATLSSQAGNWALGQTPYAGEGLGGAVLLAGICNRVLTSQEHSRLFDDFMNSPMQSVDLPRRNFIYYKQASTCGKYITF